MGQICVDSWYRETDTHRRVVVSFLLSLPLDVEEKKARAMDGK
jgi:hypothetical protein